jgi:branched-chain amino acid transport system ATP-binding protein
MKMSLRAGRARDAEALHARNVEVHFEGLAALAGVDLELRRGEILGLIGPNGAGKTTLVNVLSGFQQPTRGSVHLEDLEVTGLSPNQRALHGVARTFQSVRIFGGLSVLENVEAGAVGVGASRRAARRLAWELLEFMDLRSIAHEPANALPHGHERRIGLLRTLATRPAFLLLDEPAAGLDEAESDALVATIGEIRQRFGCGVLVIEHDMRLIMSVCERIQVLNYGKVIFIGAPEAVRNDKTVITAYLGEVGVASAAAG